MGSVLSNFFGGADSAAASSSSSAEGSGVLSFHSSARWQLHFKELKDSSQLVQIQSFLCLYDLFKFRNNLVSNIYFADLNFAGFLIILLDFLWRKDRDRFLSIMVWTL